ncbi:Uncharacterised protein [Vibrio cholerae]|nr:Uncharacterised protein [Vibrio cholerae]
MKAGLSSISWLICNVSGKFFFKLDTTMLVE